MSSAALSLKRAVADADLAIFADALQSVADRAARRGGVLTVSGVAAGRFDEQWRFGLIGNNRYARKERECSRHYG